MDDTVNESDIGERYYGTHPLCMSAMGERLLSSSPRSTLRCSGSVLEPYHRYVSDSFPESIVADRYDSRCVIKDSVWDSTERFGARSYIGATGVSVSLRRQMRGAEVDWLKPLWLEARWFADPPVRVAPGLGPGHHPERGAVAPIDHFDLYSAPILACRV